MRSRFASRARPGHATFAIAFAIVAAVWLAFGIAQLRHGSSPGTVSAKTGVHVALPPSPARIGLERGLDRLAVSLDALARAMSRDSTAARPPGDDARAAFRAARTSYKRIEALVALYSPTTAAALNGPAADTDGDAPPAPLGRSADFQRVEELLFDSTATRDAHSVAGGLAAVRDMRRAVDAFRAGTKFLDVGDTASLDAIRLELARVATLGVAGVDASASGDAIRESADAVEGLSVLVSALDSPSPDVLKRSLTSALNETARFLREHPDENSLDRLALIVDHIRPAAIATLALRRSLDSTPSAARRLWRPSVATPFDADAFDAWALAPEYAPGASTTQVELGKRLFFDSRLSGNGQRSCASCHVPSLGFTDGRARAQPIGPTHTLLRNTPTLLNVGFEPALFDDQRVGTLEDQVRAVLASDAEMRSSSQSAASRLQIDERTLRVAIAAYLRSLTSLDSRFDRAVRGDTLALSASERRGFTVFMGKARCGSCHFAPLFSGVAPPDFTRSELETIGVPATVSKDAATVDADSGRARVDGLPVHLHAFKTPTLRNVAVTAPYMHNGVFSTLEQVIDFYDAGGGRVPGQTLRTARLGLTARERGDLAAFLRSLTDTSALRCVAVTRPWPTCRQDQPASAR